MSLVSIGNDYCEDHDHVGAAPQPCYALEGGGGVVVCTTCILTSLDSEKFKPDADRALAYAAKLIARDGALPNDCSSCPFLRGTTRCELLDRDLRDHDPVCEVEDWVADITEELSDVFRIV